MLVQFTLKNFLSFKGKTTLDMTAINAYKEHECNMIDRGNGEKFLKVASIYGANASGKSNLNLAMACFKSIVQESLNNVDGDTEMAIRKHYTPFLFDEEDRNSEFQIVELIDDYEYCYGFEYNDKCIVMEWLYRKSVKTHRRMTIFERSTDNIEFGASVRKECDIFKSQIPSETLVLSALNKFRLKTDVFKIVYRAIMDILLLFPDRSKEKAFLEKSLPKIIDKEKNKLLEFLRAIDTGIEDIFYVDDEKQVYFITVHKGENGKDYPLGLYFESEGTIKSIQLYIFVRTAILNNYTIFADELNIKLHPLLLKFIIDLFYENNSSAQLIYTTHDTTLMDKRFFRRDQIWFVQKDQYGCSELTALSDFKVRSDASFEKDYLAGVYGGIPFLKEFEVREEE